VVAVTARAAVNASDMRGRRLSLRLLREALEHDPGSLQKVLEDVLDLPQEQLEELRELLERTSLDKIISASWERPLALAPPRTLEVAPPRVG